MTQRGRQKEKKKSDEVGDNRGDISGGQRKTSEEETERMSENKEDIGVHRRGDNKGGKR